MIPESEDRASILGRFSEGPERLESAVVGLTDQELDMALSPDSWTIRQIVHHIVDGDDLWKTFVKAAMGNQESVFHLEWYWRQTQEEWVESWNYSQRPIAPSLHLFRASREHLRDLVERIPSAWERSLIIRWSDGNEERSTVGNVLAMQANHALAHIERIHLIRRARALP